jgi:hypothetical protein
MLYELYHVRYKDGGAKYNGRIENVRVEAMSLMEAMTKVMGQHPGCSIIDCKKGND